MYDREEWILERAEVIAIDEYGEDYDNLSKEQQVACFSQAEADWNNEEANRLDAEYDRWLESQTLDTTLPD